LPNILLGGNALELVSILRQHDTVGEVRNNSMLERLLAIILASLIPAALAVAAARLDERSASDPPPAAKDWAARAKLPDWSGTWVPVPEDPFPLGRNEPNWKPAAARQIEALKAADKAGHPQNVFVNCLPEGMPDFILMTVAATEFLFTPGRITILGEFDGNRLRRIYTDGRAHPDDPDLTFNGHSIGHWEGKNDQSEVPGLTGWQRFF
jgi:hypothetical protein